MTTDLQLAITTWYGNVIDLGIVAADARSVADRAREKYYRAEREHARAIEVLAWLIAQTDDSESGGHVNEPPS